MKWGVQIYEILISGSNDFYFKGENDVKIQLKYAKVKEIWVKKLVFYFIIFFNVGVYFNFIFI